VATLGEAFIEVHADTKPFARELGPKLKTILDTVGTEGQKRARVSGKKISEGLDDGIGSKFPILRRRFSTLGRWIDNLRDRIDKRGGLRQAFEKLAKGNFILTRLFGEFALAVGGAFRTIGKIGRGLFSILSGLDLILQGVIGLAVEGFKTLVGVGGDFTKVQSTLALGFTKIGTALAAAAAELIAAAPAVVAMIVVIAALGAAIGALFLALTVALAPFAALVNLALALPAALGIVLGIVLPLVIAMHNLGDAMQLVFEKDPKKFAEGLKKLSPVMRDLVKTLRPFRAAFESLRDQVQRAFFDPIIKQLGPSLKATLGKLTEGLAAVASALGNLVADIMRALSSPEMINLWRDFLYSVANFIRTNSGTIVELIKVLGAMAAAALPLVTKLLEKFGDFLLQFAAWIMGAITDGRFEAWLKIGISALQAIWGLVKALIGLFAALFGSIQEGGRDFLNILTRAINKFTAWVKSPEGQKALQNMVLLAKAIAVAFEIALGWVISMVNKLSKVIDFLKWIDSHTGGILGKVAGGVAKVVGYSGGGVVPHDQLAMVHAGEPILDPANSVAKNRSILAEAGMLDVLQPQSPVVNVYIGNEQLDARTDYRIAQSNRRTARSVTTGART
jgi:hypothetical protein